MFKFFCFILLINLSLNSVRARSLFFPEKGNYSFRSSDVANYLNDNGVFYVVPLRQQTLPYKLNRKSNEFQIKDWFLQDWFSLQDDFFLNEELFIHSHSSETFSEAKRNQYSLFSFGRKSFSHNKTIPTMKEWGGLTHPPLKSLSLPLEKYDASFAPINYKKLDSPFFREELQTKLDGLSDSELSFGNIVLPFTDSEAFLKKKEIIKKAKNFILMSSLAFVCDSSTREMIDLLIEKNKEGVKTFVIADGFISKILGHHECPRLMRNAGINVILTKDFFKYKGKSLYHTKVLVVDHSFAVAGGQNMLDADHRSRGTDFKNRDVDLYFQGPIVLDIAMGFIDNWEHQLQFFKEGSSLSGLREETQRKLLEQRNLGLRGKKNYSNILRHPVSRMKGVCRFINQVPFRNGNSITKVYLELLDKTQKHLVITDPIKTDTYYSHRYKIPLIDQFDRFENFNLLHHKVLELPERDVKVDYITTNIRMAGNENVAIQNEKIKTYLEAGRELKANVSLLNLTLSNSFFGKPHYENLLQDWHPQKNIHVWNHISLMHSKVFYFDRTVSSVGSFNFHHNATDHSYESTAVCLDEKLNSELDKILVLDIANSIPLIFSEVK